MVQSQGLALEDLSASGACPSATRATAASKRPVNRPERGFTYRRDASDQRIAVEAGAGMLVDDAGTGMPADETGAGSAIAP